MLVHAGAWEVLARWLRLPGDPVQLAGGTTDCWFWPRLESAEPDVLLRIGNVLVVVEAKVQSGRHDAPVSGEDETVGDQLLRQYQSIKTVRQDRALYAEPIEQAIRECQLAQAYVVDGVRSYYRSKRQFIESRARLPENADATLVKWQQLTSLLGRAERWQRDLRAYLSSQRLDGFEGIGGWVLGPSALGGLVAWRSARIGIDWAPFIARAARIKAGPPWRVGVSNNFGGFRVDSNALRHSRVLKDWKSGSRRDN